MPAFSLVLFALAVPLAVPLVAAAALIAGASLEVFAVNWATTMQQEIPPAMLSRLSSYDALGSLALSPAGTAATKSTTSLRSLAIAWSNAASREARARASWAR